MAEWPPYEKELSARLTLCSLYIISTCNLVISRFGFQGGNLVPIALFTAYVLLMIYFPKDITILIQSTLHHSERVPACRHETAAPLLCIVVNNQTLPLFSKAHHD